MSDVMQQRLAAYESSKKHTAKYDPGQLVIFFDNRTSTTPDDKFSYLRSYYTAGLFHMGWSYLLQKPDVDPGTLRLIWYTHVGTEGHRDYPLHRAYAVKDMFDSLSEAGFRPMVLGWSAENPFPMIGGSEPPEEPKKPQIKVAKTWSNSVSGHSTRLGETPHDRVMAIIEDEERREAEWRKREVLDSAGVSEKAAGEKGASEKSPV